MQTGLPSTRRRPPPNLSLQSPQPPPAPSPSWTAAHWVIIYTWLNLKEFKSYYHPIPVRTLPAPTKSCILRCHYVFACITLPTLMIWIQHKSKVGVNWRQWGEWRLYTVALLEFPNWSVSRQKPAALLPSKQLWFPFCSVALQCMEFNAGGEDCHSKC